MSDFPPGPGLLSLARMMLQPTYTRDQMVRDYGDPCSFPTAFGRMFVVTAPDGVKAIFTADTEIFAASAAEAFSGLLSMSVLVTHGAQHRRQRKLLAPPFHGARMRAYGQLMQRLAIEWGGRLTVGQPVAMIDTTQAITLDVIIEAVFGVDAAPGHGQSDRVAEFRRELLALLAAFSPLVFVKPLQHEMFGLSPWAKFRRSYDALGRLVLTVANERRQNAADRQDILSLLLSAKDEDGQGLSDREILDQLLTIVLAGHETTAVMLAWAMYLLHGNPDTLGRLREEFATLPADADPEAIAKLPYLEAVINETLRLYPPVHVIHRRLLAPMTLCGYNLPAGTVVAAGAYATHRLADIYPDPDRFVPQRFIDRTYTPFEFLPWGGGARRCLGAAFAMYEMKLVLFALLTRYRFKLLEKGPVALAHRPGTVGPKGGIRMRREA